jgi:hypothetical protein
MSIATPTGFSRPDCHSPNAEKTMHTESKSPLLIVGIAAILVVAACGGGGGAGGGTMMMAGMAECPHAWKFDTMPRPSHTGAPWVVSGLTADGESGGMNTSLAGRTTNVPEFHDCQRLIDAAGNAYGPMAAVFAAESVTTLKLKAITQQEARSFVEVYAEGDYSPLGIKRGFNCLFLYSTPEPRARMVPVGANEARCSQPFDATDESAPGLTLEVRKVLGSTDLANLKEEDIPPVARWDRDVEHRQHYIGVKCGSAWCEIGPEGFTTSQNMELKAGANIPNAAKPMVLVKGWYDRQRLAVINTAGRIEPSSLWGTVIPDPDLEKYVVTPGGQYSLFGTWRRAAYVAISADHDEYSQKLNLTKAAMPWEVGPIGTQILNRIEICQGAKAQCIPVGVTPPAKCDGPTSARPAAATWWVKITSVSGTKPSTTRYSCMVFRKHPDLSRIPGTVRWRWHPQDEVIWIRCPEGCCEVETIT